MPNEQLSIPQAQEALQTVDAPPIAHLLQAIVDKGITQESAVVVEKLTALYEHLEDRRAERLFNEAFVKLQADLPTIVAQTVIPNRGKYERFEDVMKAVGPILTRHGFSVSFSQDIREGRIGEVCHLKHVGGHSQDNTFWVRTGKADTDTQADCKAATTAKRNALLNCLNIVIRQDVLSGEEDQDASMEGAFINAERQQYLEEQLKETGANREAFLKMAGASKIEEICNGSYEVLVRALQMKRKAT